MHLYLKNKKDFMVEIVIIAINDSLLITANYS